MRYRRLDENFDMTFGNGSLNFLVNSPETVAQSIRTRLLLLTNEWFLDLSEGTDYVGQVFGYGTAQTRDVEIRTRILETQAVTELLDYSSSLVNREFSVTAKVNTVYGVTEVTI